MSMSDEIIKGADGKWYRETESGDFELVEAKQSEVTVRDPRVHEQQHRSGSHVDYFESKLGPRDPRTDKHKLRRMEAIQRQVESLVGERVEPGANGGIRIIKDEEFMDFTAMYQRAVAKGEEKKCEYQPLATYQHKVVRARPILKGEVGMVGATILRLDVGYGEGTLIAVPQSFGGGPRADDEMDFTGAIVTRPGENLIDTVQAGRGGGDIHAPGERSETENGDSKAG
jgi:hypothetical protein